MTTISDVKKLIAPLLERHHDLALVNRKLIIKSVRHVLRFVCIDRRSDPFTFAADTAVNLSFLNFGGWSLSGGRMLYIPGRLWDTRDPESLQLLRDMIEFEALPELRAINTIDDFVAHRSNDPENSRYFFANLNCLAVIAIVKGDLDKAASILEAGLASGKQDCVPKYYPLLLARDQQGLLDFFRRQQLNSIAALKLESYFEPAPFPVELQGQPRARLRPGPA